jgi:hypothetical protein
MTLASHCVAASGDDAYYPTLSQFEAADVTAESFDHRAHVYVGWCYLKRFDLLEAVTRFTKALRRLTQKLGADEKYNETISWFFLLLIAERIDADPAADWEQFCVANGDLCSDARRMLQRYYSQQRLHSAAARKQFLLPDLQSDPDAGS